MKNFFKVTVLGLLMVVLTAVSVSSVMAQDPEDDTQAQKTALYNKFIENHKDPSIEKKQIAVDAAKEYIAKFNTPDDATYVEYFKKQIKYLEEVIAFEKQKAIDDAKKAEDKKIADARNARFKRFADSFTGIKKSIDNTKEPAAGELASWDEFFAAGDEIIKTDPKYKLDTLIVLASGGGSMPDKLMTPKYRAQVLKYSNDVISLIEAGEKPALKNNKDEVMWGADRWGYKSKDDVLGWMNYAIALQKETENKEAAVPIYYKAVNYDSGAKNRWYAYQFIGQWYQSKAVELGKKRALLDLKVEENIPIFDNYLAMEKGYAERAIDAFARAYSLASADKNTSAIAKTELFNILKELFAFRYSDPKEASMKSEASINTYVSNIKAKPMPNPETAVTPVKIDLPTPGDKPADTTTTNDGKSSEMKTDGVKTTKPADDKKPAAKKVETKTTEVKSGATRSRTVSKTKTTKNK